ncbi:dehydratase [Volucribacter amazonae]|uniref:Dehydratase n=1 Tax=Volucribacter amazonae TaxID=256731 RepID=A0A9X4PBV2_9PAST|nr:dehydratase [Volucribacter amazonae]MDG6896253.1 dehydratase [Volucribacter amazonae]
MMDLTCPITHIAPLIPHSGEMILLDRILDFSEDHLIAEAEIRPDHILLKNNQLTTLVSAEIMAQGIAAWAGCKAIKANKAIGLGFWLGSRKLTLHRDHIAIGTLLKIKIKMSIEDSTGFGVFDCQLMDQRNDEIIIEGILNVLSPPQPERETQND